jgi:prevent-host-death family protein
MEVAMAEGAVEQFNIHEAKTHLSRIIDQVEQGQEVVISRAGKPVAKVVPLAEHVHRTGRGSLRGKIVLAEDWDSPETNSAIAADFGLEP